MQIPLTKLISNFSTALAGDINPTSTQGEITDVTDRDGNTIPSGLYTMLIDFGKQSQQHIRFTLDSSTKIITNIQAISVQGEIEPNGLLPHTAGSIMTITDFSNILGLTQMFGDDSDTIYNIPSSLLFVKNPKVGDPGSPTDVINKSYADNLSFLGSVIATDNSPGLVGKSNVNTYIEGRENILVDGEFINLPNQENLIDIKTIRNNQSSTNIYILTNDGFIYVSAIINGERQSITKLNSVARSDLYKIISVENPNSIYFITDSNDLVRYTGGDTFTNVILSGQQLGAGKVLSSTEKTTNDGLTTTDINSFLTFEGSVGIYKIVITNQNKLAATVSIVPNTSTYTTLSTNPLYPFYVKYNKDNSLIFSALNGTVFNASSGFSILFRLDLSDNSKLFTPNLNPSNARYGAFSIWNSSTGGNDKIVFTKIQSSSSPFQPDIINTVDIFEITSKNPFTLSTPISNTVTPYLSRINPQSTSISSTTTLLGSIIIQNLLYTMAVSTQAAQTGFEILYDNLSASVPAATTPKVIQSLSKSSTPFTIIGRIQNYFNVASNIENKITTEQTLVINPPATAGSRIDLIVLDNNNNLQARLGVIAGAIGTPQAGDRVLGKCQTTFQGDGLDYLVNYDNREMSNIEAFGDGSDGDVVISTNTTLTRDMYYNNLTINSGIVLSVNNFKIYYNQLSGNGIISSNSAGGTAGTYSGAGGTGGAGGGAGGAGGNPNGGSGGGAGGGVIPMSLSKLKFVLLRTVYILFTLFKFDNTMINVNNFGFGGGGGGGNNFGDIGGAGGAGGGILFLCGNINNFNGSLLANAGNGAVGNNGIGGGGGGGGVIINIYKIKNGSYITSAIGGLGALNTVGGTNGANGSNGNVYEFQI